MFRLAPKETASLLDKNKVDVNICDGAGNDVVTRLLKAKQYDLVLRLMKKRTWNVNHQNKDGDTFAHILVMKKYLDVMEIIKQLLKNIK